ncbi:hypothetical protein NQZ68_036692 [Dissostichus eleginoides]|nr:hypothetical protein NQZ68_036692 [Dissostichus eleginoides]
MGWRTLRSLFVIDLIMENSPWLGSQREQGLWHLHEKYSCCAGFCHRTTVDKAQPWQTAKREMMGRETKACPNQREIGAGNAFATV